LENYLLIFFFVLGAIIGSFLNVLILRHNTGLGLLGRSFCPNCGKKLGALELVPIFSYLFQRGRCVKCKSKISSQYPLIEFATASIFVLVALKLIECGLGESTCIKESIFGLLMWPILLSIFVYDFRHKIIPDSFVFSAMFFGFAYRIFDFLQGGNLIDLLAPVLFFLPFFFLWFFSEGRWLGLGDGKLAVVLGCMLGFYQGLVSLVYSFWIGAIFGLVLIAISKMSQGSKVSYGMKSEIPFGPFMIIALALVYFFGLDLPMISLY
jgi:prepilin signal peptidase PulO-like enzyme (type II secretory pathway)